MAASVLSDPVVESALGELLRPDPLSDGVDSEQRLVICGVSWDRYLAFDKKLGDSAQNWARKRRSFS